MMIGMGLFWLAIILGAVWLIRDVLMGTAAPSAAEAVTSTATSERRQR